MSLLLMDGDGRLTERFFPDVNGETAIQLCNQRWTPFHAREESQAESSKQLARFRKSGNHRVCLCLADSDLDFTSSQIHPTFVSFSSRLSRA